MVKRLVKLLAAAAMVVLFTCGCDLTFAPEELYSLPKLPAEYMDLDSSIRNILSHGAEYAAPLSGTNIQPVQMVDLNGDGREEALVFCRNSADDRPLKIYIFSPKDGEYQQAALIEGSGTSIYSINYSDLDLDGVMEVLVGWRASTEVQALSVYGMRGGKVEELMRTNYVRYAITDLNQDGLQELVVLRADDEGNGAADYFTWADGSLSRQSSARISMTMADLSQLGRVRSGTLRGGQQALFITGVENSTVEITDVLGLKRNELTNLALSDVTGVSTEIYPYYGLYPMDIDNDGITDIPEPVELLGQNITADSVNIRIDWHNYDAAGVKAETLSTYHAVEDGWYLRLPKAWCCRISVTRRVVSPDEIAVTFWIRNDNGPDLELLSIYTITGDNREIKAVRDGRIVLSRQMETIYAAKLTEISLKWRHGLNEDELRAAFNLIAAEWTAGDN